MPLADALHEPSPLPAFGHPLPALRGEGRERGANLVHGPNACAKPKEALHERPPHPSLSPSEGERVPEGRVRGRFMAPMRDSETVEASHEPRGTSTLRRKPLPVLALGLTLLMPGCGIRNSTDNPAKENLQASSSTRTVFDLASHSFDPFDAAGAKAIVFLFVSTDCPISNRYAPEIRRVKDKFARAGVRLWLVYADPDTS